VPTYQYACTECADRTEVVQRFSDDPLTVCTVCGGRLRKVFSPVGIVFKGSGFYRTDSRNGSSTVPASDKNGSGTNGSSEPSSGSDSSSSSAKSEKSDKSADSNSPASGSSDKAKKTSASTKS
jgi:putative FmdB family regulatory protein